MMDVIKALKAWSVQDSADVYNIRNWGKGYFGINHDATSPSSPTKRKPAPSISKTRR